VDYNNLQNFDKYKIDFNFIFINMIFNKKVFDELYDFVEKEMVIARRRKCETGDGNYLRILYDIKDSLESPKYLSHNKMKWFNDEFTDLKYYLKKGDSCSLSHAESTFWRIYRILDNAKQIVK
jgi:hypothetical protein